MMLIKKQRLFSWWNYLEGEPSAHANWMDVSSLRAIALVPISGDLFPLIADQRAGLSPSQALALRQAADSLALA
jgi:hypothetical protein